MPEKRVLVPVVIEAKESELNVQGGFYWILFLLIRSLDGAFKNNSYHFRNKRVPDCMSRG